MAKKKIKKTYIAASKKGLIAECEKHMERLYLSWTKERCIEEALKYNCVSDWIKNDRRSFDAALYHSVIDECKIHMKPKKRKALTIDIALNSAIGCKYIKEFRKKDASSYGFLLRTNNLHLTGLDPSPPVSKYTNIVCSNGVTYPTAKEASRLLDLDYSGLCKSIKYGTSIYGLFFSILKKE